MQTMRSRIFNYMQGGKIVTAADIARIFKISGANARHHLSILETEGAILMVDVLVHGRGRPTQLYGISKEINQHNLQSLTSALLKEWFSTMSGIEQEDAVKKIADHLLMGYGKKEGNLTQRLTQTVQLLNHMNYQARWEAHFTSPIIIVTHCPYLSVAINHPELCRMDCVMLTRLLGQKVSHELRISEGYPKNYQCVFKL